MSELKHSKAFIRFMEKAGFFCLPIENNNVFGAFDCYAFKAGAPLFIEFKMKGKKLRESQFFFKKQLESFNHDYCVIYFDAKGLICLFDMQIANVSLKKLLGHLIEGYNEIV